MFVGRIAAVARTLSVFEGQPYLIKGLLTHVPGTTILGL
jgi:hypothetical protein